MKKTENFELNQWESTDRILMEDFNGDNAKIDAALGALKTASESQAATLAQHAALLPKLGNCRLYTTSYVGDGTRNPGRTLVFPMPPLLMVIMPEVSIPLNDLRNYYGIYMRGSKMIGIGYSAKEISIEVSDDGKTIRMYSSGGAGTENLNEADQTYYVAALMDEAAE